jgi:hypothetical protein
VFLIGLLFAIVCLIYLSVESYEPAEAQFPREETLLRTSKTSLGTSNSDAGSVVADQLLSASDAQSSMFFHPRALSAANEERVEKHKTSLRNSPDGVTSAYMEEYFMRLDEEQPDQMWTQLVAAEFSGEMSKNEDLLRNMEVDEIRCSRSVCVMGAVGPADQTFTPGADWQQFVGEALGKTWWREQFMDTTTSVKFVDGKVVYLTFVRRQQ